MSSMYLPNVILAALDAIGPEPVRVRGPLAFMRWNDARLFALFAIVNMGKVKRGFVAVPDQEADSEAA